MDAGPDAYHLADWRRRIFTLYAEIREMSDAEAAWAHWHGTRSAMFRDHPLSPLPVEERAGFSGISVYPYDPAMRFSVDLVSDPGEEMVADLGNDGTMRYARIARTEGLSALGGELPVFWIKGYGGGLYIPFTDETSGSETYGGGRYLSDAIKGSDLGLDAEGRLIVDFNFTYHPSCALNNAYVCPLALPECRLPTPIRAGERL